MFVQYGFPRDYQHFDLTYQYLNFHFVPAQSLQIRIQSHPLFLSRSLFNILYIRRMIIVIISSLNLNYIHNLHLRFASVNIRLVLIIFGLLNKFFSPKTRGIFRTGGIEGSLKSSSSKSKHDSRDFLSSLSEACLLSLSELEVSLLFWDLFNVSLDLSIVLVSFSESSKSDFLSKLNWIFLEACKLSNEPCIMRIEANCSVSLSSFSVSSRISLFSTVAVQLMDAHKETRLQISGRSFHIPRTAPTSPHQTSICLDPLKRVYEGNIFNPTKKSKIRCKSGFEINPKNFMPKAFTN
ncbi:hypothetical protein ALC57_18127 [Trachymyrmex cornetzi]|uniref:Uncharacterized protein n=1 Tax=Trachymyrmex cornetzi TaxID=471704 RepID=A0A195D9P6_9HYME|nr:hypothetical protein ALC57_18127 [Trachymyrmex cornetzi]